MNYLRLGRLAYLYDGHTLVTPRQTKNSIIKIASPTMKVKTPKVWTCIVIQVACKAPNKISQTASKITLKLFMLSPK